MSNGATKLSEGVYQDKEYYIGNEPYSKEDYFKKIAQFNLGSHKNYLATRKTFLHLMRDAIYPYMHRNGTIMESTDDFLTDTMNCQDCYDTNDAKDCKYLVGGFQVKDAFDCCYVNGELEYENCECFPMPFKSTFNVNCYTGDNIYYNDMCMNSCSSLFGCIALRHKKFCILNKQYSEEEYNSLVPKIIEHMKKTGEWGEFFPSQISPYGYNESEANQFFPLSQNEAEQKGLKWSNYTLATDEVSRETTPASEIPDEITNVDKSICDKILTCEITGKPYKIIPHELNFYKKIGLPITRTCPDFRYKERYALHNPRKIFSRQCQKCSAPILTTYSPDRPETVYCEKCYLEAIH